MSEKFVGKKEAGDLFVEFDVKLVKKNDEENRGMTLLKKQTHDLPLVQKSKWIDLSFVIFVVLFSFTFF